MSKTGRLALASVVAAGVVLAGRVDARRQTGAIPVPLEAEIRAIGALPGEPRTVSAAAVASSDEPLLTIENAAAFDSREARRLVLVGGPDGLDGDARGCRAVLEALRWFKTRAPKSVRQRWDVSALPVSDTDPQRVRRWIVFQAPDLVIDVRGGDATADRLTDVLGADNAGLGPVRVITTTAAAAFETIRRTLTSRDVARSPLHETIVTRAARRPLDIARVLARRYPENPAISYIPAVAWINTLRLASITRTRDDGLLAKVREQTQPWMTGEKKLFGDRVQLTAIAGTMIFSELAASGGGAVARALALEGADLASALKSGGVAEHGQGWTDDMFMAAAVLSRSGAMPDRARDLDTAAQMLAGYAARLQRADGIFIHAADGPIAWGRGNGFAALGSMETLTALPDHHPARARVLAIYRRHMAALNARQAPDGMWRQVIDEPGSYRELTATAMILSAMARGIRLGWLDRTYVPGVRRAWRALMAHVADDGTLVDVCAGTGAGPTKRYYLDRPATTGADDRGGAMALLASMEMIELGGTGR